MSFVSVADIEPRQVFTGFRARFIHSATMTLAYWDIDQGAELPEHAHPHEQIAQVLEGEFEMTIDGKTHLLTRGQIALIPSEAVHSGRAVTACKILDTFHPVREDYRG